MKLQSISIRSQLLRLVLACIIPALLMALCLLFYDYFHQKRQLERDSLGMSRAISVVLDTGIQSVESALSALATSPHLSAGDIGQFYIQARELLGMNIVDSISLDGFDGKHYFNTLHPLGSQNGRLELQKVQNNIMITGMATVTGILQEKGSGQHVILISIPVIEDGRLAYSLTATVYWERVVRVLYQQNLPPNWFSAIIDGSGRFIGRTLNSKNMVGKPTVQLVRERIQNAPEGVFEGVSTEKKHILTVYTRSYLSGWTVLIGIPMQELTVILIKRISTLMLVVICLTLASIFLAWKISKRIADSIHGLTAPALALGAGNLVTIPPLYLKEAEDVGAALLSASKMLASAQHDASHDGLTGLSNRGMFSQLLEQQLAVSQRYQHTFCVLYLDLDGFKAVNDDFGHVAGDKLLIEVAQRLRMGIRSSDVAARLGGDEFAVILLEATEVEAERVGTALVERISMPYHIEGVDMHVSASVGIAECRLEEDDTIQDLLRRADAAMYEAKRKGKRCVIVAGKDSVAETGNDLR